jgi:hypothetical protein
VAAVEKEGFTVRQAGFLVTVMLHSGVCMRRQYGTYARIAHGQKIVDFFSSLVARKVATTYSAAHGHARIFHIHAKRLYTVIHEPNNRNRKPVTLARAIERLMLLDAVLAEPQLRWLGTEREKVEYFGRATPLRADELPSITFGRPPGQTVRYFPDKLPIGLTGDGRTHVFLYLVNRDAPVDLRAFLHRHAELLRALPEWELRLLVPRHLNKAGPAFEAAARQELAMPLRLGDVEELGWYFRQRRKVDGGGAAEDSERFQRAVRQFHAPRFRALYRLWRKEGDTLVYATVSRILGDALTRRTGQIRSHVLPHSYQHLFPLVGSA